MHQVEPILAYGLAPLRRSKEYVERSLEHRFGTFLCLSIERGTQKLRTMLDVPLLNFETARTLMLGRCF